jgi:hypothetical protein
MFTSAILVVVVVLVLGIPDLLFAQHYKRQTRRAPDFRAAIPVSCLP